MVLDSGIQGEVTELCCHKIDGMRYPAAEQSPCWVREEIGSTNLETLVCRIARCCLSFDMILIFFYFKTVASHTGSG